jgi:H+-translocating NAD(P) transhydrogenase subunit alpha
MGSYEVGLYVFMLAAFLGFELVKRVSPLLHTPLMSLSNAISAIAVVGAILVTGKSEPGSVAQWLGFAAVVCASLNVFAGYLITDRMLKMFKKRDDK